MGTDGDVIDRLIKPANEKQREPFKQKDKIALFGNVREHNQTANSLNIRLSGDIYSIPYTRYNGFHYNKQGGLIVDFTTYRVTIRGKNLLPILDSLERYKLTHLRSPDSGENEKEFDTFFDEITVEKL